MFLFLEKAYLVALDRMANCPCFGFRKGKKQKSGEQTGVHENTEPESSSKSRRESSTPKDGPNTQSKAKIFTYRELATATKNFKEESFIGRGGFGAVFKGQLEWTGQVVAVKQLDKTGFQGEKEFLVEVLMLSLLRHPNLVNLIGYCAEGDQRLLVYEYMPLGSLEDHLHDLPPHKDPLDWNTRMMIAAGAAKGLEYLHQGADPPVIYRDMKAANILLCENFHPKLSDFGLAKFGPTGDKSHVSTRVMGTQGYCAPEYAKSGKLTAKSDIYSFGVVMLELITGGKAVDTTRGGAKRFLVDWARTIFKDGRNTSQLADPLLRGRFSESTLRKALEVAFMCLREDASSRPTISDVVLALNYLTSHKYNQIEGSIATVGSPGSDNSQKGKVSKSDKDFDREQAVAEAKMWGERLREQRRQTLQTNSWVDRVQKGQ